MDPGAIVLLAGLLPDEGGCKMATLAYPVDVQLARDPNLVKLVADSSGRALYFSRSLIPHPSGDGASFLWHIGAYAYLRDVLLDLAAMEPSPLEKTERLEQLRALDAGIRIRVAVVEEAPKGIDTMQDYLEFVRRYKSHGR